MALAEDRDDYPMGGPDEGVDPDDFQFDGTLDEPPPVKQDLPRLWDHCVALYAAMEKTAVVRTEGKVWEGSLVRLLTDDLGLGNAHYTAVTRRLKSMQCIQMLRRGGGPQPSTWLLKAPPTPGAFRMADDSSVPTQSKAKHTKEQMAQRLRDLTQRVDRLERLALAQGWPL